MATLSAPKDGFLRETNHVVEPECNQPADDGNESKTSAREEKKTQEAEYADTDNHDTNDVQRIGA